MSRLGGALIAVATALVILAAAIVPFLTGPWMSFAQARAEVPLWTGWQELDVRAVTDAIVGDLVFGGDFEVVLEGVPVLEERERAHMRDVRDVFHGFALAAIAALASLAVAIAGGRVAGTWRAVRAGALALSGALVVGGLIVAFAFDAAFTLFHGLFFAAGSWTFDPATDRLVQLFPERFWIETTVGIGVVAFAAGLLVAWFAARRSALAGG